MDKSIEMILEESRERALRIREQELEEEREKLRLRTLEESNRKISAWKKEHQRKKKTPVKISVCREYNMSSERFYYKLRLFIDEKLDEIYNIDETAGLNLTSEIEPVSCGGLEFYTLFSNK